ncbi:MAG: YajQ family cyclic di-GMP-binding protein [Betaproteobacteria bacterium]|nr:YajQ family cyclic di-GMP-binding protein [Betaproteobacteria bacterium]MDE2123915.1 YajQ family cyclic di-GMP-binding protein [Betaproteobacteria bacterium]MDE2185291.1 YajQ family cyclic di-GMP-binding protein [Betaproteobacteria bacterium]MDE2324383.1 YajQ family cyclic di-GMP-binding protein [Betaproteobacteria bacterium]
MPSFDAVLEPNLIEIRNAVDQTGKETNNRFDFKGSSAKIDLTDKLITAWADNDFQLGQVRDVLMGKMAKRNVDVRFLDLGKIETIGGDKVKQVITVKSGIPQDLAKRITATVKESKLKLQSAIQGDVVRITGAKRDDLQAAMALLTKAITDAPLSFTNFRE